MDYKWLDNQFSNMDDNEDSMLTIHLMINDTVGSETLAMFGNFGLGGM